MGCEDKRRSRQRGNQGCDVRLRACQESRISIADAALVLADHADQETRSLWLCSHNTGTKARRVPLNILVSTMKALPALGGPRDLLNSKEHVAAAKEGR